MKELHVGHRPDRKLPILTLFDSTTNKHTTLAIFKSDRHKKLFIEACKNGVTMDRAKAAKPAAALALGAVEPGAV